MTQPSPADELRAAAEKLREHADAASPGPWTEGGVGDFGWNVAFPTPGTGAGLEDSEQGRADAAYIALMDPDVGHALADWLDYHAAMSDRLAQLFDDPPLIPDDHPALAVARALNGDR
ncbi:hypothetical protein [Streptomyces sp. WAC08241]|uniref:hypothetical protein n=1 Tax=Streptomyces sp. WAC08241 TaxID=2487421 RepID=UPI000F7A5531|nr:hypothetical protein [Streptomyces sp. WAC08241]RSS32280.1 hypothetical protein EF906_34210 [Streptomyces sp. WAC08241]